MFSENSLDEIQRGMKSFIERWQEENNNRISVTVTPKKVIAETSEKPVFLNPQIDFLYEYSFDIPAQILEEIKALPRETLIADLNAILYDSIGRHHVFMDNDFDEDHGWFPLHTLWLMREIKAEESLETILDFLSQSEEFLEYWLSDMLTESIWSVLAMCGQNNLQRLLSFMKETGRYTWSRSAAAEAVNQLALHGFIPKEDAINWMRDVLEYYINNKSIDNLIDTDLNGSLIAVCLDLQAKELLPLIEEMLKTKIASVMVAGDWETVQKEMDAPFRTYAKHEIETITQTYLRIHNRNENNTLDEKTDDDFNGEEIYDDYEELESNTPFVKNEPKIGRNDPCNCGSGIKYKKCHGKNS